MLMDSSAAQLRRSSPRGGPLEWRGRIQNAKTAAIWLAQASYRIGLFIDQTGMVGRVLSGFDDL
jgi:hypothetical protein